MEIGPIMVGMILMLGIILAILIPFYSYLVIQGRKRFGKKPMSGPVFYDEIPFGQPAASMACPSNLMKQYLNHMKACNANTASVKNPKFLISLLITLLISRFLLPSIGF